MLKSSNKETSVSRVSPSCEKVREWISDYISEKKLGPGDRMPSERTVSQLLGANRYVVGKAFSNLVAEGLLRRETGNGTFLCERGDKKQMTATRTIGLIMPVIIQTDSGELIGMITPVRPAQPFTRTNVPIDIAHGISSVFHELGYRLVVHSNHSPSEQGSVLDNLANENFDGVIAIPNGFVDSAARFAQLKRTGLPIVFVDRYFPDIPIDRVVTDNFRGARDAVRYLISRGHRRIAYFTNFVEVTSAEEREAGYSAALEKAGIPYDDDLVCGPGIVRQGNCSFVHALKYCLGLPEPVTAIFGMNDDMVLGAIQSAGRLGLSIPDDIEVAGFFDSSIPEGMKASFTRLVQDRFKIGQIAARLLLERMRGEGPSEPQHIMVPAEMITAESDLSRK